MRAASFVSGGLIPAALRGTSNGLTLHIADWVRNTASFFEIFLCLSRACLGKIIVYIYKWLSKMAFFAGGASDLATIHSNTILNMNQSSGDVQCGQDLLSVAGFPLDSYLALNEPNSGSKLKSLV